MSMIIGDTCYECSYYDKVEKTCVNPDLVNFYRQEGMSKGARITVELRMNCGKLSALLEGRKDSEEKIKFETKMLSYFNSEINKLEKVDSE